jgi:hypothetical protein
MNASLGVIDDSMISCCCTNAANFPKSFLQRGLPLAIISPRCYDPIHKLLPLPESTLSKDVFPEPLGPRMAMHSPGFAYPQDLCSTYLNAPIDWDLSVYSLYIPSISILSRAACLVSTVLWKIPSWLNIFSLQVRNCKLGTK